MAVSESYEKADKKVVSLADPDFVLKVLKGIQASSKSKVLEDINELLKHFALTSKYPEEIAVVTKVWAEYMTNI